MPARTDLSPGDQNVKLRRAMQELRLLNEVAVDVSVAQGTEEIVHILVKRSLRAVGAEQGVVSLISRTKGEGAVTLVRTSVSAGKGQVLRPDEALLGWMAGRQTPLVLGAPHQHEVFGRFAWDPSVHSVVCVPLLAQSRLLGVLTLFNKRDGGSFTDGDARLLTILGMQSAQTIEAAQAREDHDRVRNVFGRHTAPAVVEELLRYENDPPSRRTSVCIMFLDVRGFTTFAESAEPEAVVDFLNALFAFTTEAVTERGGIVHQLLGDGFMAVFGAPIAHEDDCERAVEASLAIVACVAAEVEAGRMRPTTVGIGLHYGEVIAGVVGSAVHKEYKVTGDAVNIAARIEGLNKTYDSHLLVSEAVWDRLTPGRFRSHDLGPVAIRGRDQSLGLHQLA